jgi:ribonuclease J
VGEIVRLTFHGGVAEIGGNKILLEDRDARIWLDMGQSFGFGKDFFVEPFLTERARFGLRDLFALDLMPKIPGLYAQEHLAPTDFPWRRPEFSGVAVSHIHFDHINHIQYMDPDIPVFLGEGTRIMLESWMTTARGMDLGPHAWKTFRTGRSVAVDGVEIEPIHVDHSAPAAYGFLIHTSDGTIAYTGDLRRHGPHAEFTDDFEAAAKKAKPIAMITEGTRVAPSENRQQFTEAEVRAKAPEIVNRAKGKLVFVTFYPRDVDRIKTFHAVADETHRQFVLSAKTAHLLWSMKRDTRIQVPDVIRDPNILVYFRQLSREDTWEKDLKAKVASKAVDATYVNRHQGELMLQLDYYQLPELVDLKPVRGSPFIHSKSEPFDEEDITGEILGNWLKWFGLEYVQLHASGHCSEREVRDLVRTIAPKTVVPVHTEHPDRFVDFGPRVMQPSYRGTLQL